ncbi:MAG TPA: tRNA (adenosine(37)-N6)-threonylcarbamoyltransferase complex ATPase subunit type 1 TsaE [Chitinophagales bacterium]|nr:tRNA (adenosine(37)-N6)-threonylcarbamoyltransferase complex ATPase subunit type 1 TsaE [Chitinophagales bacterium]
MIFTVKEIEELEPVADEIIQLANEYSIFCFYGDLGAGKTTLIKLICEKLNVVDTISSPTYPIINEYNTIDSRIIYHIDLYRLKSIEEALNIGIEEYLYSGNLCFIEWPDNFKSILPTTHFNVKITKFDESRSIEMVSSI